MNLGEVNPVAVSRYFIIFALCIVTAGKHSALKLQAAGVPVHERYSPVAPPQALLHAARLNLNLVADWLREGDFESAADTVTRVQILIDLCEVQNNNASWRDGMRRLRAGCERLANTAKERDAAASMAEVKEGLKIVETLDGDFIKETKPTVDEFTPRGSVRAWMKLLEGTYTEAKVAKSLDEFRRMAYTIAEVTNAAQFLRNDAIWRQRASETRQAALELTALNPDTDLKVARQELKNVYQRCQACHKEFKR